MEHEDRGLRHDLARMLAPDRRALLQWMSAAAIVPLVGCTAEGGESTCSVIPQETGGPFPGDGTNGVNALAISGIVRRDIRTSIGPGVGTAAGIPFTIRLTVLGKSGCAPLAGQAVYVWQCDRDGAYSMYRRAPAATYLRGVQMTDAKGQVEFLSIFPACYAGRWPHVHFEVYPSDDAVTDGRNAVATSQMAMPEEICRTAYATSGYERSIANFARSSLATDNVFGDDRAVHQMAAVTGDPSKGYVASFNVTV